MAQPPTSARALIYDPSLPGFDNTEVMSSADRLSLTPSQFKLKQNYRSPSRVWQARGSDVTIALSVPSGATARTDGLTAPIGAKSLQLNGTWYHFSAWNTASGTAIFYLNPATGTYTEITDPGNVTNPSTYGGDANGKTRLATQTTDISFTVASTPRKVEGGVEIPSVDILVVQNGEDYPFIWYPSLTAPFSSVPLRSFRLLPLTPPTGALNFKQVATWGGYFQIAGGTGSITYAHSNARYEIIESTAAPYNAGSNFVPLFTITNLAATGDTTSISGLVINNGLWGNQIDFLAEGTLASVTDIFTNTKLEIQGASTYYTIYDQSSSSVGLSAAPAIRQVVNSTESSAAGATNHWLVTYPLTNVPLTSDARQYSPSMALRFTRKNGNPAGSYSAYILMVAGPCTGGGFDGGGDFSISYVDAYTQSETGGIKASALQTDVISNIGGAATVNFGATTTSNYHLVEFSASGVNYDYNLNIVNSTAGVTIKGGMQQTVNGTLWGIPTDIDIYWRTAGELAAKSTPLFWQRVNLYTANLSGSDHQWSMNTQWKSGGNAIATITIPTYLYGYGGVVDITLNDQYLRDPGVGLPSAYNIALPRAKAMLKANSRLFAGQIKTPAGNYCRGDIYFSRFGFDFRFTSVQDQNADGSLDEASGSRLILTGETIQRFTTSAASYAGTSSIYCHTDQTFNTLGHAFAWQVNTLSGASDLSLRVRVSNDGTLEPRSVDEYNGLLMWWNQHGVLVKYAGGEVSPLSYLKFDDIFSNIPSARRGLMSAQIHNFRYKCAYTPTGGTTNSRVMIWNVLTGVLESIDTMANGSAETLARAYDSTQGGAGQRLFTYGSDGKVYGYEEGTGNVAVRFITRELTATQLKFAPGVGFYVDTIELGHDTASGAVATATCYPDFGSSYNYTIPLDTQSGSIQWIQQQNPDTPSSAARTVYIDYQASVPAGSTLREMTVELMTASTDSRTEAGI